MSLSIAIFVWQSVEDVVWQCVEHVSHNLAVSHILAVSHNLDVSHNLANCSPVAQCVWQHVAVCVSWASLVVAWHELQCVMWSRTCTLSLLHSHAIKYTIHYCAHTTTGLHASFISLISHMQSVFLAVADTHASVFLAVADTTRPEWVTSFLYVSFVKLISIFYVLFQHLQTHIVAVSDATRTT